MLSDGDKHKLKQSLGLSFIAGWLAGLTSTLITFPLDTIKTVNQATIHQRQWHAIQIWWSLAKRKGLIRGPWIAGMFLYQPLSSFSSYFFCVRLPFLCINFCLNAIFLQKLS